MEEVFDKIKEHTNKAKDGAAKITKTVIDKTNSVVSQTKLKYAISETSGKIDDIYKEMGKAVYERYLSDDETCCDAMREKCEKIDALNEEIEELKMQLAEIKETVKCPKCGAYNNTGSAYCSKCGEKLYVDEEFDGSVQTTEVKPKKPETNED